MTGLDRVERRGEKIDFARGPTFGEFARGAVAAGPAQVQIRHSQTARPPRAALLHLGRGLLDVVVGGPHLSATIRCGDFGGKDNQGLGPGAAGGRVIVADAFALLIDGHPDRTRQCSALGLRDAFTAEQLGARKRLRLELRRRCGRGRLRVRRVRHEPKRKKRAHKHCRNIAHGPRSRDNWNSSRECGEVAQP
jgi:hypothetical protein